MNAPTPADKKRIKILFWVLSPFLFVAFLRLVFLVSFFIYGQIFLLVAGRQFTRAVLVVSLATSVGLTAGGVVVLYRQLKRHILEEG